jgi:hypothetical protein
VGYTQVSLNGIGRRTIIAMILIAEFAVMWGMLR